MNIKLLFVIFTTLALTSQNSLSQTTLQQGEVMVVGFYGDGESPASGCDDAFAFISYVNLLPGTVIRFSEEDFDQWETGKEGDLVWTNTTGHTISAFTGINIITHVENNSSCGPISTNIGAVSFEGIGQWDLSSSNEEIIVFQGPTARTLGTPISLFLTDDPADATNTPTGLNAINIINFDGVADDTDLAIFTGPTTFSSFNNFVTQLTNTATNWTTENGTGDHGKDGSGIEYPSSLSRMFFPNLSSETERHFNFSIYPNPTTGPFINMASQTNGEKNIAIYSMSGKLIKKEVVHTNRIDLESIESGFYILIIREGNNTTSKKLMIP